MYRDSDVIENGLESPLDEFEHLSAISEIPAYKSANQELAGVLKNLRRLEQHIKGITFKAIIDFFSPLISKTSDIFYHKISGN